MIKAILTCFCSFSLCAASIMSKQNKYLIICESASKNPDVFSNFRQNKAILRCIEGLTRQMGCACLKEIPKSYLSKMHLLNIYDEIGRPRKYPFPGIGKYSPCTLRYVMILANLKKRFGSFEDMRVLEIGGGFGGLCAIMSILESKKHYGIIDLPCVLNLAKTFLDVLDIQDVSYIRHDELEQIEEYDLLISNYAFSEIDAQEQLNYLEKVISKIPRGFMAMNFTGKTVGIHSLDLQEVKSYLENAGHQVQIEPELTQTNPHNPNVLLTWGNDLLNNQ